MDTPAELRLTFDTVADLYDRSRPGYPEALYEDRATITGILPPARVLEIGPGTGKATVPLARLGYSVTAIELGESLAAVARRNLAPHPNATVQIGNFEAWTPPAEHFDLVVSATAFHWLDRKTRLGRCSAALRPGGWLAVWSSAHVDGGDLQFWVDSQECYERWMPGTPPGFRLTPAADLPDDTLGLESSAAFERPLFRRYEWTLRYTRDAYLDVLRTYSDHIALPEPDRSRLFACIGSLIDGRYGGAVTKAYLTHLTLARRRP